MTFKDKLKRFYAKIYGIINKFCAIIKKHNPIGYDDARLILFGLLINSLSHYTTGNKTANAITLGITILCLVIFAKLERRIK